MSERTVSPARAEEDAAEASLRPQVLAEGPEVSVQDLQAVATPVPARGDGGQTDWFGFARIEDFRAATEKEFLRRKLLEFGGNIKRTAENIDLQRSNLYKKLERYGLK